MEGDLDITLETTSVPLQFALVTSADAILGLICQPLQRPFEKKSSSRSSVKFILLVFSKVGLVISSVELTLSSSGGN